MWEKSEWLAEMFYTLHLASVVACVGGEEGVEEEGGGELAPMDCHLDIRR